LTEARRESLREDSCHFGWPVSFPKTSTVWVISVYFEHLASGRHFEFPTAAALLAHLMRELVAATQAVPEDRAE
jgi:hypothetical protein